MLDGAWEVASAILRIGNSSMVHIEDIYSDQWGIPAQGG
jgi:hypothetical protein